MKNGSEEMRRKQSKCFVVSMLCEGRKGGVISVYANQSNIIDINAFYFNGYFGNRILE